MTNHGGGWTECVKVVNTAAEDISCMSKGWFDNCVDWTMANWTGNEVMVALYNGTTTVYAAHGPRNNAWTYELLTSTDPPACPNYNSQYDRGSQHTNTITLNDNRLLTISGKNSGNQGWGGSWGNGYGVVVQTAPAYASNNVLVAMAYQNTGCYQNCSNRSFQGIDPGHEVMYSANGSISTSGNASLQVGDKFLGTFRFLVR
jgi:hypothetical protein